MHRCLAVSFAHINASCSCLTQLKFNDVSKTPIVYSSPVDLAVSPGAKETYQLRETFVDERKNARSAIVITFVFMKKNEEGL
jgi:hypothetical protein